MDKHLCDQSRTLYYNINKRENKTNGKVCRRNSDNGILYASKHAAIVHKKKNPSSLLCNATGASIRYEEQKVTNTITREKGRNLLLESRNKCIDTANGASISCEVQKVTNTITWEKGRNLLLESRNKCIDTANGASISCEEQKVTNTITWEKGKNLLLESRNKCIDTTNGTSSSCEEQKVMNTITWEKGRNLLLESRNKCIDTANGASSSCEEQKVTNTITWEKGRNLLLESRNKCIDTANGASISCEEQKVMNTITREKGRNLLLECRNKCIDTANKGIDKEVRKNINQIYPRMSQSFENNIVLMDHNYAKKEEPETIQKIVTMPFNSTKIPTTYEIEKSLIKHIKIRHKPKLPYNCTKCPAVYNYEKSLKRHISLKHNKGQSLKCNELIAGYEKETLFTRYNKLKYKEKPQNTRSYQRNKAKVPFSCTLCPAGFDKEKSLMMHINIKHKQNLKDRQCGYCGRKNFKMHIEFENHVSSHHGISILKCDACNLQFKTLLGLKHHNISKHGIHPVGSKRDTKSLWNKCMYCSKIIKRKENYKEHINMHTKEIKFNCNMCEKVFTANRYLRKHMQNCHSDYEDKKTKNDSKCCEVCGKIIQRDLNDHMLIHKGEFPYVCDKCGKGFRKKQSLMGHYLRHTGEKPYSCHFCGKKYRTRGGRKYHLQIHNTDKS